MGKRGPAPTPTALKLVAGTRSDRVNRSEPRPIEADLVPPAWLDGHDVALAEWARLAPDLVRSKVAQFWDAESFAEYCMAVDRIAVAAGVLKTEGAVIDQEVFGRDGTVTGTRRIRNPWSLELKDALQVSAQRAARFGLTPADRSGLSVVEVEADATNDPARLMS